MFSRVAFFAVLVSLLGVTTVQAQGNATDAAPIESNPEGSTHADDCCSTAFHVSAWTVDADALWLRPSSGENMILGRVFDVSSGTTVSTLSSGDATYPMQAGARFRLAFRVDEETRWEATYYGLQNFSAGRAIKPDVLAGQIATSPWTQSDQQPFGIGGFDGGLSFQDTARLHNVELNRQRQWINDSPWSVGGRIGIRYFQWDESCQLSGANSFPWPVYEEIDVRSGNHLVGPQFGVELERRWDRLDLRLDGQAGLFANFVRQTRWNGNSSGVQPGGFPPINLLSDGDQTVGLAGIIDFSVTGSYELAPHVALRGGYQLLYVAGLGLAPIQLAGYSHGSDLFLHGPSAGVEVIW